MHSRGNVRAGSWRTWNSLALDQKDQGDRTSDRRGSNAPPHKGGVPSECRSNSQPTASGSAVLGRWMDGQCGYKTRQDTGGCHPKQQTDQSSATSGLAVHDPLGRTHRTRPPVLPALDPSSPNPPTNTGIESAIAAPIKEEFFNRIRPKRIMLRLGSMKQMRG